MTSLRSQPCIVRLVTGSYKPLPMSDQKYFGGWDGGGKEKGFGVGPARHWGVKTQTQGIGSRIRVVDDDHEYPQPTTLTGTSRKSRLLPHPDCSPPCPS